MQKKTTEKCFNVWDAFKRYGFSQKCFPIFNLPQGIFFITKLQRDGQALMARDIKAITQTQKKLEASMIEYRTVYVEEFQTRPLYNTKIF